jgi:hypothetical protein
MTTPQRTLARCLVCGFAEIHTDEVVNRGTVLLAECVRCSHRWTVDTSPVDVMRLRRVAREAEGAAAA